MKRYVQVVIAVAAFLAQSAYARQLGDLVDTPLGKQYRAEIEVLAVSPKLLPSSCRLLRQVRTASLFPATTNPFVTDDAALIRFVSLIGFGSDAIHDVSVAMSALYYDSQSRGTRSACGRSGSRTRPAASRARACWAHATPC